MQTLFNSKTTHCNHDKGCLYASLRQGLQQIKYGFIMSSIFQIIKLLKGLVKGKWEFFATFDKNYFSIIIFLCSSSFVLRIVKCFLRWIRNKDDGFNSFLAGSASGYIGTLLLNKQYCYMLLMFVSSRLVGAIYKYLLKEKYLDIKKNKLHFYFMFLYANYVNSFGFFLQPDILKPDMYNLYKKMACLTTNQKKWHKSSLVYKMNYLKQKKYEFYDNSLENIIKSYKV